MTWRNFNLPPCWLVALCVLWAALGVPSPTFAQDMTDDEVERFQAHVTDGAEARRSNDHEAAVAAFRAALEIHDHPRLTLELASSLTALEDCGEARQLLREFLARDEIEAAFRQRAEEQQRRLDDCDQAQAPHGQVAEEAPASDETQREEAPREEAPREEAPREEAPREGAQQEQAQQEASLADEDQGETQERINPYIPVSEETSTPWWQYAGGAGLLAGAGLIAGGIYIDLGAAQRAETLRAADDSGDPEIYEQWSQYNRQMRNASIALYASGAAVALASAGLLTWQYLSRDDDTTALVLSPRSVAFQLHW